LKFSGVVRVGGVICNNSLGPNVFEKVLKPSPSSGWGHLLIPQDH